jgi:hypothetical protein
MMMSEKRFEKEIKTAMESTRDVPEPFKTEAFKVILNHLLQSESSRKTKEQREYRKKPAPKDGVEVEIDMSRIPTPKGFHDWNWHDRFLFLLDWAGENHPDKGLTASEIRRILDQRFGFYGVDIRNISRDLKRVLIRSPYATRKPIHARLYRWFITPDGAKCVQSLLAENSHKV